MPPPPVTLPGMMFAASTSAGPTGYTSVSAPPGSRGDHAIVIDDDDDVVDAMQVDPSTTRGGGYNQGLSGRQQQYSASYAAVMAQEKKVRSKLREERHIAQCVLMDRELLTVHALSANETIPQTRRRFLAQLLAPDNPAVAASIARAADSRRFVIPAHAGSSSTSSSSTIATIPRTTIVDVYEDDDAGWRRPTEPGSDSSSAAAAAVGGAGRCGESSSKSKCKTPERSRERTAKRREQHQQRDRERRRRWSGAERDRRHEHLALALDSSDVDMDTDGGSSRYHSP
ncbi:hypothetical protein VTN77DRAFT_6878 [Rasamsonia byssochlamydoides]|uniref:uncharacterized protein n=1 Tax=Rasamsonia byssochlamydoides TaxID=89139 RepID=UPI003743D88D